MSIYICLYTNLSIFLCTYLSLSIYDFRSIKHLCLYVYELKSLYHNYAYLDDPGYKFRQFYVNNGKRETKYGNFIE